MIKAGEGGAGAKGGFDILAGRSGSAVLHQLNPAEWARLMRGISALAGFYDVAILDLGAGADALVLNLAQAAQTILIVLTDEPTSLTDAYALIKRLAQHGRVKGIELLINMAADHQYGRRTAEALNRAARGFLNLELPVAGIIRRDPKVREAIRRQAPFMARFPQSPAAADVSALSDYLIRAQGLAPAPASPKIQGTWR
ncbi:MAG TPA: hypothetical protein DCL48_05810 [Alphaproteobacteria bacterium]|nr:hypothetical protein [Alphaproteobacteria bacterium]